MRRRRPSSSCTDAEAGKHGGLLDESASLSSSFDEASLSEVSSSFSEGELQGSTSKSYSRFVTVTMSDAHLLPGSSGAAHLWPQVLFMSVDAQTSSVSLLSNGISLTTMACVASLFFLSWSVDESPIIRDMTR